MTAQEQYFERMIFYDNLSWILFGIATLIFVIRVLIALIKYLKKGEKE